MAAPWKPIWVINNCSGWNVMRSDGTAWVHGECEVSWRVWMGPVPVEVASWTVQQEFTYAADGYQDIYYPAFFRGKTFESPTPLE